MPVQRSLLSIAAQSGFYEGIRMLIDKGAKLENGNEHPLLTALSRGNRECFIALIDGREEVVLDNFQDHSLAYYAIQYDTTLLPLLASLMKQEYEKLLAKNSQTSIVFPPADLNNRDRKKFETALKYEDNYYPYDFVRKSAKRHICPWQVILDKPIDNISQNDEISKEDHYDNTNYSTSQIMSAHSNAPRSSKGEDQNNIENYSNSKINSRSKSSKTSKVSKTSNASKSAYSNNYDDEINEQENESSTRSESEVSDHLTFSALDDEDQVLKTNSDPFRGGGANWVPLAQRKKSGQISSQRSQASSHKNQISSQRSQASSHKDHISSQRSQASSHKDHISSQKSQVSSHRSQVSSQKSQKSNNYESDKKKRKIQEEENSLTNDSDELSEPTYEQSDIVRTDVAAAGDFVDGVIKEYDDEEEDINYGYEYEYEEEEEEEEESFFDE